MARPCPQIGGEPPRTPQPLRPHLRATRKPRAMGWLLPPTVTGREPASGQELRCPFPSPLTRSGNWLLP